MSHYISASYPAGETELSPGTSGLTLSAIANTGFDFYEAYDASHHNYGSSGDAGSEEVSHEVTREAFLNSLAWVMALQSYYAEHSRDSIGKDNDETKTERSRFGVPIWKLMGMSLEERLEMDDELVHPDITPDDQQIARNRSTGILRDLQNDPPDDDTLERSLYSMGMIIAFTWNVYRGTPSGVAELSFF